MKKPIAFLLTLTLLLSSFPIASALDSTNENKAETISAEEFFQAIQDEYAKFHIGYTAEGYDPSATFTQDFLNERLNDIRSRMSSVTNYSEELQSFVEIIPEPEPLDTAVPNAVMPYKKTYSMTKTIKSPSNMGAADIYAEVVTTIDAQYNVFMSIDDMTTKQLGYAFNFESWTQHDGFESKIWTQNGASNMECYATGTLVVSWTGPVAGIKHSYSSEHTIGGGATL